jgi:hypothetical protein
MTIDPHTKLAEALDRNTPANVLDAILAECPDAECPTCAIIICPYGEPLHFHHDGCPACAQALDRLAQEYGGAQMSEGFAFFAWHRLRWPSGYFVHHLVSNGFDPACCQENIDGFFLCHIIWRTSSDR